MKLEDDPLRTLREGRRLEAYGGPDDDPTPRPGGWLASVAVIFRHTGHWPELLLIERAAAENDPWSGHMAFPGGRREAGDDSLLETAIRETREETGIDLAGEGEALGRLALVEPQSVRLPKLSILPFVFTVPAATAAEAESREVAESFWVPFGRFLDPEAETSHHLPVEEGILTFPAFSVSDRVVWGLTRRILDDLLERIR